ncbi:outer membrane lipoprotein-sorting protein [Candidatus Omnitrophota bacterium]
MKKYLNTAFIFIGIFACGLLFAENVPVQDIVEKANKVAYYEGSDGKAEVSMVITDSQGRTREKKFVILRMDIEDAKEQKYYVYFKEPSDVQDMVYMVWKHLDGDDDRWLYLPALDLVRRVAASDKRSSFVGSDFLYEDVSGRSLDMDLHELVESDREGYYKIKNTPKEESGIDFKYYHVWIDRSNFMPMKAEYYDEQGRPYRIVEALEVGDIEGHPTVIKSKVTDLSSGSSTVLEFKKIDYDIGLSDDIFTERYLRRPPAEWLE